MKTLENGAVYVEIGEIFVTEDAVLLCVHAPDYGSCVGCFFRYPRRRCGYSCHRHKRPDKKSVIFVRV